MRKRSLVILSLVQLLATGCGGSSGTSSEASSSSIIPSSSQAPASSSVIPSSSQAPASSSVIPSSSQAPASSSVIPSSSQAPASSSIIPSSSQAPSSSEEESSAIPSSVSPSSSEGESSTSLAPIPSSVPSSEEESSDSSAEESSVEPFEPVDKDVTITMVSHFKGEFGEEDYEDVGHYSDTYFLGDSTLYNPSLALISAMACGASQANHHDRTGQKLRNFLEEVGYEGFATNEYYAQGVTLADSIGIAMAKKRVVDKEGNSFTLLGLFPRNAGYQKEWAGDFNMGVTGPHKGFLEARDEALRFLKSYIEEQGIEGNLKLWGAGYSRGAAVVNMVGGFLALDTDYLGSSVSLAAKDLYVYGMGTPRTLPEKTAKADFYKVSGPRGEGYLDTDGEPYVPNIAGDINFEDTAYACIHSTIAVGDFVTKLPPKSWGFTRLGQEHPILYGGPEMVANLEPISPETAAIFEDGFTYATPEPIPTFDLIRLLPDKTGRKESLDEMIENRIEALMNLGGSRENSVENGYTDILAAMASIFGVGGSDFAKAASANIGSAIKAALLNYLAFVSSRVGSDDKDALVEMTFQLLELLGKKPENPDSYLSFDLLQDLLDYLINDAVAGKVEAVYRVGRIASLLPEPYGDLYANLIHFAMANEAEVDCVDSLLALISAFVVANEKSPVVAGLIDLVAGIFPADKIPLIGFITGKAYSAEDYPSEKEMALAAISDLFHALDEGVYTEEGEQVYPATFVRNASLSLVGALKFSNAPSIANLLTQGSYSDPDTRVEHDPSSLPTLFEEALGLLVNEEGEAITLEEAANASLDAFLFACSSEDIAPFIDTMRKDIGKLRQVILTPFLTPEGSYSLRDDIAKGYSFVDGIISLFPVHNHELYIASIRTLVPKDA